MVNFSGVDGTATVITRWTEADIDLADVGTRVRLEDLKGESLTERVLRTARPARMDSYDNASNPLVVRARESGVRSSAGAPIVVDGRLWGVMAAASTRPDPLPEAMESRLAAFTTEVRVSSRVTLEPGTALGLTLTLTVISQLPPGARYGVR